jgi:N6-L-threonylcarbamoyladenine synthase
MLNEAHDDFSFSGLKTSVRYFLRDHAELLDNGQRLRDLCASIQAAIVEVLVTKTVRAARRLGVRCVTASGGVTCNRALRKELAAACQRKDLTLRLADRSFCTDNAAMIGILAERRIKLGAQPTSLDAEIAPGWSLS